MKFLTRKTAVLLCALIIMNMTACGTSDEGALTAGAKEPAPFVHTKEDIEGDGAGADSGAPCEEEENAAYVAEQEPQEEQAPDNSETAEKDEKQYDLSAMTLEDVIAKANDAAVMQQVNEYFADTLFIGDSRTVGMAQYAEISAADYFCATGMSVYNLFKDKTLAGPDKTTLDALLSSKTYGKIYIMLGINELGYNLDSIVKKYNAVIDRINELQPGAAVVIQANMHVTQARSDKDEIYNNTKINNLNAALKQIADERQLMFLDVNPVFDDQGGNLNTEYTFDHTHVLGKYYRAWGTWLYLSAL